MPEKTKTLLPEKSNTSTLVEKRIEKEKLATPGSMILTNLWRGSQRGKVVVAKVQGHPARNQPHEGSGKGQASVSMDPPVQQTESPFIVGVLHFPLPEKFRMP